MLVYDINNFNSSLCDRPYCSDNLQLGLRIRKKEQAIAYKYIQVNDNYIKFLVIDCDHSDLFIFEEHNLPAPNLVVKNKENGHFHYVYALVSPVYKDYINKAKNLAYFAKIQQAYTNLCKGDPNYINMITKNPNSNDWQVVWFNHFYAYELNELADSVDLPEKITKKEAIGEGRNCWLFDTVRKFAYKEVLFYKNNGAKYEDFFNVVLNKLEKSNHFEKSVGLGFNELKAIAKSISKWTWQHFTAEKFSEIQSHRNKQRKKVKNLQKVREEMINEFS